MTRYPPGLISALEKLHDDQTVGEDRRRGPRPTSGSSSRWTTTRARARCRAAQPHLFDTHPPIEERIAALREL